MILEYLRECLICCYLALPYGMRHELTDLDVAGKQKYVRSPSHDIAACLLSEEVAYVEYIR